MEEPSLFAVCADTQGPTGQLLKTPVLIDVANVAVLLRVVSMLLMSVP